MSQSSIIQQSEGSPELTQSQQYRQSSDFQHLEAQMNLQINNSDHLAIPNRTRFQSNTPESQNILDDYLHIHEIKDVPYSNSIKIEKFQDKNQQNEENNQQFNRNIHHTNNKSSKNKLSTQYYKENDQQGLQINDQIDENSIRVSTPQSLKYLTNNESSPIDINVNELPEMEQSILADQQSKLQNQIEQPQPMEQQIKCQIIPEQTVQIGDATLPLKEKVENFHIDTPMIIKSNSKNFNQNFSKFANRNLFGGQQIQNNSQDSNTFSDESSLENNYKFTKKIAERPFHLNSFNSGVCQSKVKRIILQNDQISVENDSSQSKINQLNQLVNQDVQVNIVFTDSPKYQQDPNISSEQPQIKISGPIQKPDPTYSPPIQVIRHVESALFESTNQQNKSQEINQSKIRQESEIEIKDSKVSFISSDISAQFNVSKQQSNLSNITQQALLGNIEEEHPSDVAEQSSDQLSKLQFNDEIVTKVQDVLILNRCSSVIQDIQKYLKQLSKNVDILHRQSLALSSPIVEKSSDSLYNVSDCVIPENVQQPKMTKSLTSTKIYPDSLIVLRSLEDQENNPNIYNVQFSDAEKLLILGSSDLQKANQSSVNFSIPEQQSQQTYLSEQNKYNSPLSSDKNSLPKPAIKSPSSSQLSKDSVFRQSSLEQNKSNSKYHDNNFPEDQTRFNNENSDSKSFNDLSYKNKLEFQQLRTFRQLPPEKHYFNTESKYSNRSDLVSNSRPLISSPSSSLMSKRSDEGSGFRILHQQFENNFYSIINRI